MQSPKIRSAKESTTPVETREGEPRLLLRRERLKTLRVQTLLRAGGQCGNHTVVSGCDDSVMAAM